MPSFEENYADKISELSKLEKTKNWQEIERLARQILVNNPNSIYTFKRLGHALEKQGKRLEAIDCYENAIEIAIAFYAGHSHFINRLDILYRREKMYDECLQLCLYNSEKYSFSEVALSKLSRIAKINEYDNLSEIARELAKKLKEPIKLKGELLPISDEELDKAVKITQDDIDRAIDDWNKTMPELAGMLEAEIVNGETTDLDGFDIIEDNRNLLKKSSRPIYSESDIENITKKLAERLKTLQTKRD